MDPGPPDPEASSLPRLCWAVSWRSDGSSARDSFPGKGSRDRGWWGLGLYGHVGTLVSTFQPAPGQVTLEPGKDWCLCRGVCEGGKQQRP